VAFSDPQSVTVSGTAISLPRTSSGQSNGGFTSADGLTSLTVSHQYGKRNRRMLKLTQKKTAASLLDPSRNEVYNQSVWVVFDVPTAGFTVAESKALGDALTAYLSASTGARITQLLGGES